MTSDIWHALAVSASILVGVLILIVIISIVTVRRGEVGLNEEGEHRP